MKLTAGPFGLLSNLRAAPIEPHRPRAGGVDDAAPLAAGPGGGETVVRHMTCTPLRVLLGAMAAAVVFLLLSLLLPSALARPIQQVLGWGLAGSVAALAVASLLGALENLLDEA